MPDAPAIPSEVRNLADQLVEAKPMRRGSVSQRFVKCNKVGCPCGDDADARHGPYYSVSRVVGGQTRSRWLGVEQAALVRAQVGAGQEFRKHLEDYWQACERWADGQLEASEATSQEVAEKKGSKRRSRPKSSRKSGRS